MTTYTETWTDTDTTTESAAAGGCCCGPTADEAPYGTYSSEDFVTNSLDDAVYTEPSSVWLDEEPSYTQDSGYTEPASVIPAGQPGGPALPAPAATFEPTTWASAPAYASTPDASASFEPTTWASAPAYASTPDPAPAFEPTTWASAPAYSSFVGGNDFGGITILDAAGNPADLGPSSMVIGPSDPGSAVNSLTSIYGIAAQNGDVMSQILVQKALDSMNRSTLIWTL